MDVYIGGVYVISEEWQPYDEQIINHRPVIVIEENGDDVDILLMGILQNFSKRENSVLFEIEIEGNKYFSSVATDVVHRISKSLLRKNIGYVRDEVIDIIYEKQGRSTWVRNKKIIKNEEAQELVVMDDKAFEKIVEVAIVQLRDDVSVIRGITEEKNKPINVWKDRAISFGCGVISSLIVQIIIDVPEWSKIIEEIVTYMQNIST